MKSKAPSVAWTYGLLGLIPFAVGGVMLAVGDAKSKATARRGLVLYGALIASFLGGGRWGLEIADKPVRTSVISASMAPTVASFLLALLPRTMNRVKFAGLAAVFAAQWVWDTRSSAPPTWYPPLRTALTAGALAALLTGLALG
ncbi:MAG: DUF3429 domain-containing protein [Caulobacteraceae bacterium]